MREFERIRRYFVTPPLSRYEVAVRKGAGRWGPGARSRAYAITYGVTTLTTRVASVFAEVKALLLVTS